MMLRSVIHEAALKLTHVQGFNHVLNTSHNLVEIWHLLARSTKTKNCGISKISSQPPRTGSGATAANALEPFTENVQKAFPAQSLRIVPIYTGKSVHKVNL